MKHIYSKDFKYTRAKDQGPDYLKRKFDKMFEMDSTNAKGVRRMLPNGLK